MQKKIILSLNLALILSIFLMLVSCGGGGSDDDDGGTTIETGKFLDGAVQGMSFKSGGQSGVTDESGTFTYEVGQAVTFSIGAVTIGQATGQEIVTPMNLVSGGSSTNVAVQNITRFLMMLDNDEYLINGINISQAVNDVATNWSTVDFTTSDLVSELSSILQDVSDADNRTATLPDAATAKSHLESTVFGAYSGGFTGTYSGSSNGTWAVVIDALTGKITGIGYDNTEYYDFAANGQLNVNESNSFAVGVADSTATWNGIVSSSGAFSGTWEDVPREESGNFSGSRVILSLPDGATGTVYTGTFTGTDVGVFTIAIDENGEIVGTGYSGTDDENFFITGNLAGDVIAIGNTSTGTSFTGTFVSDGTFSGTWSGDGFGSFSGCKAI